MAIISASRRTDIPAFHSKWFMDKIVRGAVMVKNPFGAGTREVSLRRADVDGIVFWSRDYRPMLDDLSRLKKLGYPFYCHFTIIGYPKWLDPGSPSISVGAATARRLARDHGPGTVVWRYDPVLLAEGMEGRWHLENFRALASMMEGATDECVTSFIDFYAKFSRSLPMVMEANGAPMAHPGREELLRLLESMAAVAGEHGMKLAACCEKEDVRGAVAPARCVDRGRMERVAGVDLSAIKSRPTRRLCGCHASVDIGGYDSCPAGCAYCYANRSQKKAAINARGVMAANPGLWPIT